MNNKENLILIAGATGYVGGRLVPVLIERNYSIRCLARDPSIIEGRAWENVESIYGDVLDYSTLEPALEGVFAAYYLIHSMAGGRGFHTRDLIAAENFGRAAKKAGVKRIIYLGGLGEGKNLSEHLESRQQTGEILRQSGVVLTEFRAAQIIGSGSASFELIRNSVERIPILITTKSIRTRSQPIAIRDVLRYLADCLELPQTEDEIIEIGGSQILTYREMMLKYAEIRGLKRRIIESALVTPRLNAFLAGLVTPIPNRIAKLLLEGLKNEVIVHDKKALRIFDFTPISYEEAVKLALIRIVKGEVPTTWQDAYSSFNSSLANPIYLTKKEGLIIFKRQLSARADIAKTFQVITRFGGEEGWLFAETLWHLRGFLDRLIGGVGLRRSRRCPTELRVGDTFGFWRVEDIKENRLLRLRSEMKMKSRGWLQFEVEKINDHKTLITQTAFFEPKGVSGLLYWYILYPVHKIIFSGMIKSLVKDAEKQAENGAENNEN